MTIQEAIDRVIQREDLSASESADVMRVLMSGQATPSQIAAFLVALRMKGETVDEITGLARTMREFATRIETKRQPLVDTCGTGGDRSGTFNISTTAAFVVAGAGVAVAKHGNRSASSQCGSADVLEALGVNIEAAPECVARCIDEIGIGFLFARTLHTAMRHVAPVRQELKTRTVFNLLGPLTNPANATGQVVGVFDRRRIEDMANVLTNLGVRRAFVVHGSDGLDELTLAGPSYVAESKNGAVSSYEMHPAELGFAKSGLDALAGGDSHRNAVILAEVLSGEAGPRRDIVVLNAAAAILAGESANDWAEAIEMARASIDSGQAARKLEAMKAFVA